ncbi:uncharacterized protein LOC121049496 isoform X1 [Rosa chinensis]|uniref:uncharacterized protein LOC121049496 isoform X1 n=1 Tax=Rosa chinensis TaxID=74649 RepID=UPI001AD92B38|nr:uncharacterized protein LOC121049496 isoform X1 [Rosa chinensis]
MYCTKVGIHGTASCSYTRRVPNNAPVGPGCELVCRICESPFSGTCCGLDEGRAILKECIICGAYGDHWPRWCPRNNRVDKKLLDLPPGKVEQKEPAKPASVKTNAVKDDDPEFFQLQQVDMIRLDTKQMPKMQSLCNHSSIVT